MPKKKKIELISIFSEIEDPRIDRQKLHKLTDIIFIAVAAVISGADSWTEIATVGTSKEKWFRKYLELPNGIPSHDTFARVFALLDASKFIELFQNWVKAVLGNNASEISMIAIDGKTSRRSYSNALKNDALHLVSAWSSEFGLTLGQVATHEKSNEINAIPQLLDTINIKNTIISIDAMGCQKNIAKKIIDNQGNYILALKNNQKSLFHDVQLFFDEALNAKQLPKSFSSFTTSDSQHGRIEQRQYFLTSDIQWLIHDHHWEDLTSIGCVISKREVNGQLSTQTRFFITSLKNNVELFANAVRNHWSIENSCHWSLDVIFNEDQSRISKGHAPQNFAILRKFALAVIRNNKSIKVGAKAKRLKAACDNQYLKELLFEF